MKNGLMLGYFPKYYNYYDTASKVEIKKICYQPVTLKVICYLSSKGRSATRPTTAVVFYHCLVVPYLSKNCHQLSDNENLLS